MCQEAFAEALRALRAMMHTRLLPVVSSSGSGVRMVSWRLSRIVSRCAAQLVFASAYHKLEGKHVLFAQGFHCTGMPIKVRQHLPQSSAARPPPRAAGSSGGCTSRI